MSTTHGIVKPRLSAYNMIDPARVYIDPTWNARFDLGDINELANQIKAKKLADPESGGLINAIRVEKFTGVDGFDFKVVDGERRMTAVAELLKAGEVFENGIPARFETAGATTTDKLVNQYLANEGKKFLPLEEAAFFKRLRDDEVVEGKVIRKGLNIEQIGKLVGKAHLHIVNTLALITADESLKDAVKTGKIGGTMAKQIATAARGDLGKQAALVNDAIAAGKDVKKKRVVAQKIQATKVAKAAAKGKTLKIRALTDDQLSELGAKMAKHLQALIKEAKVDENQDLVAWVKLDEKLAVAYTLGALDALKAAAGAKVELEV